MGQQFWTGLLVGYLIGRFIRWTKRNNWKAKEPTQAQIDFADDLGIRIPKRCTRGQLSELIDKAQGNR